MALESGGENRKFADSEDSQIPQHFSWSSVFIWKLKLTMIKRLLNIFTFLALSKQWGSCVCVRGYLFEDTEMKFKNEVNSVLSRAISDLSGY